ncbi:hypothetical protein [Thalassotalea sp. G2M2-11]|uniref:hypothetical protein n=1 Tax=Thalassotalea sp. G2M2-11 TaxID=2787627 RepID=UPI0019D11579|nr:hypothetical protein [Thalassotalea sp. G2M2-11]
MKIFTHIRYCILVMSLITFTSHAYNKVSDEQVYTLMDKSGITRSIQGLPMQMNMIGQQMALTAKDPAEHQKFMQIFTSSMDTDGMVQKMLVHIQNNVSASEMESILAWLDSDLATRIVKAELQSTEPEFQQNFMRFMADMQSNPPAQARTQAIIHYVESSKVAEQAMKMMKGMMKNMFMAIKASKPEDQELAANLDKQLEQMSASLQPVLKQQMILTSYFIYQNISNEDLANYSNFFMHDTGKKYLSVLVDAVGAAMNDWGATLMKNVIAEQS